MARAHGTYTEENAWQDLPVLLETAGLATELAKAAELLQCGHNALFSLPGGMVMRHARPGPLAAQRAQKVAELGKHFRRVAADTIWLAEEFDQPIQVGNLWATIWMQEESRPPEEVSGQHIAASLKKFHALDAGSPALAVLPRWKDPLSDTKNRVKQGHDNGLITADEHKFLNDWITELDQMVEVVRPELEDEFTLVHGDPQVANVLFRGGTPILCDFDSTIVGPPQLDLATIAVSAIRFDKPQRHDEAVETYGVDVKDDPQWELFGQLREAKLVTSVIPELGDHPALRQEFDKRYRCVKSGGRETWTTYVAAKKDYDEQYPDWRAQPAGLTHRRQLAAAARRGTSGSPPSIPGPRR